MVEEQTHDIEYRGYTLIAVEHSPGWRVNIYANRGLLHIKPDSAFGITKEEALAKARAAVDAHL